MAKVLCSLSYILTIPSVGGGGWTFSPRLVSIFVESVPWEDNFLYYIFRILILLKLNAAAVLLVAAEGAGELLNQYKILSKNKTNFCHIKMF
jgi:hypothetical protein